MVDFVTVYSSLHEKADVVDSSTFDIYSVGENKDSITRLSNDENENINVVFSNLHNYKPLLVHQTTKFVYDNDLLDIDTITETVINGVKEIYTDTKFVYDNDLLDIDTITEDNYRLQPGAKDSVSDLKYQSVDLTASKPKLDSDFKYTPVSDFNIGSELVEFTTNFDEPIDYSLVKTRLSPVDNNNESFWNKNKQIDLHKKLTYGYSINNFLVGGIWDTNYPVDEDALEEPDPDPVPYQEVIRLVNVVNVVKLPERTPVKFTNFTLAHDLDSIAWVANFEISDLTTLDLIKPVGLTTVDLEININGELWNVFVARTSTRLKGDRKAGVKRSIRCTCYSRTKLLTYPYTSRRSHTETSASTPGALVTAELSGHGFTADWNSDSWTIPANIFSYFEKSPLAAISELAESVGAVIVPSLAADSFTIEKRYAVSPWNWSTATVDRTLNEAEFFSIDTDWQPQEKPDSIYVYGEENGGAAVKCVRQGTAGLVTLPTVVNKYITDTIAGTERGRIEVSKNHIDELVPLTTYVDSVNGVVKPRELLEINMAAGGTWRGMVAETSLSIQRNGTAIIQSLKVERFYE